jgi:hypothetical protein
VGEKDKAFRKQNSKIKVTNHVKVKVMEKEESMQL